MERRIPAHVDDDEEDELEITPMIDMTFLLLIFFMVATAVAVAGRVELPQSETGRAEQTEGRVVLVLDFPDGLEPDTKKSFAGSQFIALGDARLSLLERPDETIAVPQLDATLRAEFAAKPNAQFILQASRKMPFAVVREILKSATSAGARETLVAVSIPRYAEE
jgi:biopolymer transport protein ExbD